MRLPLSPATRPTLRWRIVSVLLVVSLLPLALLGTAAFTVFKNLLDERAVALQRALVAAHARSIESHLETRQHLLQLAADTSSRQELTDNGALRELLDALNRASNRGFLDLGVIAENGSHLAYVGPYDLADRNYRDAEWFREVMARGVYVSDVFLGFRQVPHIIIATRREEAGTPWILRATISSEQLDAIVRTGVPGGSAEAFLLDLGGRYQTAPRVGSVLDPAPLPLPVSHSGLRHQRLSVGDRAKIVVTSWINNRRWLLVVQQDEAEVRAPVIRTLTAGALLLSVAVLLVVATTIAATRHLGRQIDQANREREELFSAFLRSAKLASVGELASGLAHEINNPLAIISAEQTNLSDLIAMEASDSEVQAEMQESVRRLKCQVERCAGITTRMLQFGRKREHTLQPLELAPRLEEVVALMQRQANVRNIELRLDVAAGLPTVLLDAVELEQVLINLITNAFSALPRGGSIVIAASRHDSHSPVCLEVRDDGLGMPPEVRERVFEPFFTTKPPGQGTGLGLSVCYGIVCSWSGQIGVESEPGCGTTVRLHLPVAEPAVAGPSTTPPENEPADAAPSDMGGARHGAIS